MEELICEELLWKTGLITSKNYNTVLDEKFLKNPDSDLLLKLENCCSDCESTFDILYNYWKYQCKSFSIDIFGKYLLSELERVYNSQTYLIDVFAIKTYKLWEYLPAEISKKQPFLTLCYADDGLSYGDENHTREIYQELFNFYK
ncbi:MAG: hypothetical protein ACI4XH_02685 [Acutalibacteraceae bacterium]